MDYSDIPDEQRQYVRKKTYNAMTTDEKALYIKYVKKLVRRLDELDESDDEPIKLIKTRTSTIVKSRSVAFVGMKYRGGHVFSIDDHVRLEADDDNPMDKNAIKVMLKRKKWEHVAFVDRDNAKWLRTVPDFEKMPLRWEKNTAASATYRLDFTELNNKGIRVNTKQEVLGPNKFVWRDGYHEYDEYDDF